MTTEKPQVTNFSCPDCGEVCVRGHEDVCQMAWVVQDRVPMRIGVDEYRYEYWSSPVWEPVSHDGNWLGREHHGWVDGEGNTLSVRCLRQDLPPIPQPVETPPTPDPGEGWRLIDSFEVIQEGDEYWWAGEWILTGASGKHPDRNVYRRRITPAVESRPAMTPPNPGEGWRWLEVGEVIADSDQYESMESTWHATKTGGDNVRTKEMYRRRVTQPEKIRVQFWVPRRIQDGEGDWPVRATILEGEVRDSATWIPVEFDGDGQPFVRRPSDD